jgi:hypothetical protein
MAVLSNGSIFCACNKDNFIRLIEMSARKIDYLLSKHPDWQTEHMSLILQTVEKHVVRPAIMRAPYGIGRRSFPGT